jgi:hypothetical protein
MNPDGPFPRLVDHLWAFPFKFAMGFGCVTATRIGNDESGRQRRYLRSRAVDQITLKWTEKVPFPVTTTQ